MHIIKSSGVAWFREMHIKKSSGVADGYRENAYNKIKWGSWLQGK